jgi:hypothetical protein
MDIKLKLLNQASYKRWNEIKTNIEMGWKELCEVFLEASARLKN